MPLRIRLSLTSAFALLVALLVAPVLARAHAPLTPDSPGVYLADRSDDDLSPGAQVCSAGPNDCSLRGAIIKANANPGSSVVLFAGQVYTLSIPSVGGNDATNGDLNVISDMTITTFCFVGPCSPAVIQGTDVFTSRILTVLNFAHAQVTGIVIRHGDGGVYVDGGATLTLTYSMVEENHTATDGAGIRNYGYLFLENTRVTSNTTTGFGGGIATSGGTAQLLSSAVVSNTALSGGGIDAWETSLDVQDSDITDNYTQGGGAGISIAQTAFTMDGSRVTSNTAHVGYGGGIIVGVTSTAEIHTSSIGWNKSGFIGGGIYVDGGMLTLIASTVFSNEAATHGGGLSLETNASAHLENATLSGNRVGFNGGGLELYNTNSVLLLNVTVANNVANKDGNNGFGGGGIWNSDGSQLTALNTIVAGNHDLGSFAPAQDCKGALLSSGYNLIGSSTGCSISGGTEGNLLDVDPLLGPLRDNGGPTWTQALSVFSPAVDTASPLVCLLHDQRGFLRPYNGTGQELAWCDIGAFEYHGPQLRRLFLPVIRR